MSLHRLTSIELAVPDVAASAAFFTGFGLDDLGGGGLATRDGGEQLRLVEAPHRSLRRLGIGADEGDDLARIARRCLEVGLGEVVTEEPERLVLREPVTGLVVEITPAPRLGGGAGAAPVNAPGHVVRRDRPAPSVLADDSVRASNLTHLVYGSPDQPTTLAFFTDVVGFEVSDQLEGVIAFTRCGEVHHNLAIQAAPVAFPHHIAFEVDSIDDVVRGGSAVVAGDPGRHVWGVGRHAIGSNWFWYLREPGGTFVEYTADVDRISSQDAYRPKEWSGHELLWSFGPPPPGEFLEPVDLADLIAASA